MIKVYPKPNENIEKTLRRLKKICEREGILKDYRKHQFYESPGEIRRRKERIAKRRRQKESDEQSEGQGMSPIQII